MGCAGIGNPERLQGLQITGTNVKESIHFKRGIALMGYCFDFSDVLRRYFVKQYGHIAEYYAIDKTALRSVLYGRIEKIVEVQ